MMPHVLPVEEEDEADLAAAVEVAEGVVRCDEIEVVRAPLELVMTAVTTTTETTEVEEVEEAALGVVVLVVAAGVVVVVVVV